VLQQVWHDKDPSLLRGPECQMTIRLKNLKNFKLSFPYFNAMWSTFMNENDKNFPSKSHLLACLLSIIQVYSATVKHKQLTLNTLNHIKNI
jgi:hypothetical protein